MYADSTSPSRLTVSSNAIYVSAMNQLEIYRLYIDFVIAPIPAEAFQKNGGGSRPKLRNRMNYSIRNSSEFFLAFEFKKKP